MPNNWTVVITHYDINTATETVITENFISLPKATDTGTEEINSATLVLSAPDGKFITTSPIIDEFDRIRISILDGGVANEYNKVFDVIKITPSWTKSEGVRLTLFLQGMEHHLQKINYIKPHFYEGAKEVVDDIANSYNNSKGTIQPTLLNVSNNLPTANFAKNNYDYAVNQDTCHNRMVTTVDKLGGSVSTGGALDFYDIRFTNSAANFTTLALNVFSSGSPTDGSEVTISESTSVNVGESESGIDSQTGSVMHSWGAVDSGSLPVEFSKFKSGQRRFSLYPLWLSTVTYPVNSIVQDGATVYICILEALNKVTSNATYWTARTANTDFGSIVYSPWTDGNAAAWKDGGIDPTDSDSSAEIGQGFFDGNIIVQDTQDNWFRTVADVRVSATNPEPSDISSSATLKLYLYNSTHFYRGFRVLLQNNSAPSGTWAGTDTNGVSFTQAIVECTTAGTEATAVWRVVYASTTDDLTCTIRDEGITYKYDTGASTWTAGDMATEGDHLHPYTSLTNVAGVPNAGDSTYANNTDTAIMARYDYTVIPGPPLLGVGRTATQNHMIGAWLNFTFPFPAATINGAGLVGSLYGGAHENADVVCEPATFDTQNMHLTHNGFRGFNVGDASEDFGQVSSLDFWMKFHYQSKTIVELTWDDDGTQEVEAANFIMTCLLVDTEDNVVSQDFTISFNNQWDEYKLPIGGFNIYRGRKPADSVITTVIPPKELEISNIFRWRNIKHIIIQTKESYDEEGRYRTSSLVDNRYKQVPTAAGVPLILNTDRRIDLYIDALHWTKPLLVNTGQDLTRCLEGEFLERPEIMDYFQLKNDANAELEKRQFRHVEFDITTTGTADINFGDYFLYVNSNLIPDEFETSSGNNTIKLVAKHIEYSITKPVDGKGGYLRRILGVRRFT
jgi:hypothetical protein